MKLAAPKSSISKPAPTHFLDTLRIYDSKTCRLPAMTTDVHCTRVLRPQKSDETRAHGAIRVMKKRRDDIPDEKIRKILDYDTMNKIVTKCKDVSIFEAVSILSNYTHLFAPNKDALRKFYQLLLISAIKCGAEKFAIWMLNNLDIDVNFKDCFGETALSTLVCKPYGIMNESIMPLLFEKGADPNTKRAGTSVLATAITFGNATAVDLLLRVGVTPTPSDGEPDAFTWLKFCGIEARPRVEKLLSDNMPK